LSTYSVQVGCDNANAGGKIPQILYEPRKAEAIRSPGGRGPTLNLYLRVRVATLNLYLRVRVDHSP